MNTRPWYTFIFPWLADRHTTQAETPKNTLRKLPPMPPPQVYQSMAAYLSTFTPREKQQLMNMLYRVNFVAKQLTRMTINPIIGMTGLTVSTHEETPTIEETVAEFLDFNSLDKRDEQRLMVTSYVNTGELCLLAAPYLNTQFTQRVPSTLIRQTLVDPMNPYQVIGVVLEPYYFDNILYIYKTICDERRLSKEANTLRSNWIDGCFFFANFEEDEPEAMTGLEMYDSYFPSFTTFDVREWMQVQRRGVPLFFASSDLFTHLVDTLWAMLDKVKSWNLWNYDIAINTNVDEVNESIGIVQQWQDVIGIPQPNSPLYHDHNVEVKPLAFPMQSFDLKRVLDMMLQVSGMGANITPYDLGDQHTTFATAKAMGNPTEQFRVALQGTFEDIFLALCTHAVRMRKPPIPTAELAKLKELSFKAKKRYGIVVQSPELGNKDLAGRAAAFHTNVQSLKEMALLGLWEPEDLAQAGSTLSRQTLEVEINPRPVEELTAPPEEETQKEPSETPEKEKPATQALMGMQADDMTAPPIYADPTVQTWAKLMVEAMPVMTRDDFDQEPEKVGKFTITGIDDVAIQRQLLQAIARTLPLTTTLDAWTQYHAEARRILTAAGREDIDLLLPRLAVSFQNARQFGYIEGIFAKARSLGDELHGLQYKTMDDPRVRWNHYKMHNVIQPIDSPFWQVWKPLNGHKCRCFPHIITKQQFRANPDKYQYTDWDHSITPDKGFGGDVVH